MAKVDDTKENFEICMQDNCLTCPSYPKGSQEGLCCARGPSKRAIEKRGCNCPGCPVWIDNGLLGMYYCAKPAKT
jgi:hypothetical protein